MILREPRFAVRPHRPGDAAALREALETSHAHLERYVPWARSGWTLEEAQAWVSSSADMFRTGVDYPLLILDPSETRVLGETGYHPRGADWAEIGMWIRASEAGRGLGQAVLRALLRWGLSAWTWRRLDWVCAADNVASARVAIAAGMRPEGRLLRDDVRAGRLPHESLLFRADRAR